MEQAHLPAIYISETDYERLSSLAQFSNHQSAIELEEEISRATVMPDSELPAEVVTMNSVVKFRDVESGKESQVTLVYPEDANADEGKISILVPIGIALIGMRPGKVIEWPVPKGTSRKLQVVSVSRETEAAS